MDGVLVQRCCSWHDLYDLIQACRRGGCRDIIVIVAGKKFKLEVWRPPMDYYRLYLEHLDGKEFLAIGCDLGYDSPNDRIDRWHLLGREEEVLRWAGVLPRPAQRVRPAEPVL